MKIDLLNMIYRKELSENEVDEIYEAVIEGSDAAVWWEKLSMSRIEATAFIHGASFQEIARWRHEGWPTRCKYCGKEINMNEGGWMMDHDEDISVPVHIDCLPDMSSG